MSLFALFAVLVTVTALMSWVNERFLRLPPTIGVMAASLGTSILLVASGWLGLGAGGVAERFLGRFDFRSVLLEAMLCFLLFAGALHVDLGDLMGRRWSILSLATVGVLLSTVLVGSALYAALRALGLELPYVHALLLGALISPTDPIAVLGILRRAHVPRRLETLIVGESLFNDGVGVVVFTTILAWATGGGHATLGDAGLLFLVEAVGGAIFGLGLGLLAYWMLKSVDNYTVEILITLSATAGGYSLAGALHTSGPIAMVVAGLFIGNHGRTFAMSESTRENLDKFWELMDEILNAMLFVLIGFEVLILDLEPLLLLAGAIAIPVVLASRFASVGLPLAVLRRWRGHEPHTVTLMTWAGLRGGISIALALSLPATPYRDASLVITYVVVAFSILGQGLTVGRMVRRLGGSPQEAT